MKASRFSFQGGPLIPQKKWERIVKTSESTGGYLVDVILVHDIPRRDDAQERLERFVGEACSIASNAVGLGCRVYVYRLDLSNVRRNFGFEVPCAEFSGFVQSLLTQKMTSNIDSQPRSKVVFITYEIGAWLVKNLLYNERLLSDDQHTDSDSLLPRLAGTFFLGAESHQSFSLAPYVNRRLLKLSNANESSESEVGRRFMKKLRSIDALFREILQQNSGAHMAETTWLLPPPDLASSSIIITNVTRDGSQQGLIRKMSRLATRSHRHSRSFALSSTSNERYQQLNTRLSRELQINTDHAVGDAAPLRANLYLESTKSLNLVTTGSESMQSAKSPLAPMPSLTLQRSNSWGLESTTVLSAADLASRMLQNPASADAFSQLVHIRVEGAETSSNSVERQNTSPPASPSLLPHITEEPTVQQRKLEPIDTLRRPMASPPGSPTTRHRRRRSPSGDEDGRIKHVILRKLRERITRFYSAPSTRSSEAAFYDECLTPNLRDASPNLYYSIKARKALVDFERGKDQKTRSILEDLISQICDDPSTEDAFREIKYFHATVLTRLGEHASAYEILTRLRMGTWFLDIEDRLRSASKVDPHMFNDPLVEVVINTSRVIALLESYYGHFTRSQETIDRCKAQCSSFLVARRGSQDILSSLASAVEGPVFLPINVTVLAAKIELARAKIFMLQGKDDEACDITRPTLRRLEGRLSRGHVVTIEATLNNASILARRLDEGAETACATAIETSTRYLGEGHPFAMDALATLADIFFQRSRPYEALDTAFALRSRAREKLGKEHPQTMKYWCQVGDVNLSIGNYLKARNEYQQLYDAANQKWGQRTEPLGMFPDLIRYKVKCATANFFLGHAKEAEITVLSALREQLDMYYPNTGPFENLQIPELLDKLKTQCTAASDIGLYPDILESLTSLAVILAKHPENYGIQIDTLRFVHKEREQLYGGSHHLSLSSQLELAFASLDTEDAESLARTFEQVAEESEQTIGLNHTITWRAKLGSLFTSDMVHSVQSFRGEATEILAGQAVLLGECHPIVLNSLWRLFVFQLWVFNDDTAHELGAQLLSLLRLKEVRQERLIESLQFEEQIARLYTLESNEYEHGLPIIIEILEFCRTAVVSEEFVPQLDRFGQKVCDLLVQSVNNSIMLAQNESLEETTMLATLRGFARLSVDLTKSKPDPQMRVDGMAVLGRMLQQAIQEMGSDASVWLEKMELRYTKWKNSVDLASSRRREAIDSLSTSSSKKGHNDDGEML